MRTSIPAFYMHEGLNVATYDRRADIDRMLFEDPIPFYLDELAKTGGPMLELGCGTGRLSRAAAEKGYEVVGLDLSPAMLAWARRQAPDLSWIQADMTKFLLASNYSLITIPMRGLMELTTPEAQRACLRRCRDHLAPGGRLVFDLLDPDLKHCLPEPDDEEVDLPPVTHPDSGNLVIVTALDRRNDPFTQTLEERWRFREIDQDGSILKEETELHRLRWIYRSEMKLMLELSGFVVEAEYSSYSRMAATYGADQIWVCSAA